MLKLVHNFRADNLQKKLEREFRDAATSRSTNEIGTFVNMFGKTKDLWFTKLATSVEEHNRMTDQVDTSSKRVKELSEQLKIK